MSLVDTAPIRWDFPEAQELHAALCEVYPTSRGAMFVAAKAGLDQAMLFGDQPAYMLWKEVLDLAATGMKTRTLVKLVVSLNPEHPRRALLDALLAAGPIAVPLETQPRDVDGAPVFLSDNDDVTEPEALLFRDDLTLPIGRVPWLISVLRRMQAVAPAICRIQSSWVASTQRGTGFRISQSLVLTNWHVLHSRNIRASGVTAEFGFDDDGQGGGLASQAATCDVATIRGEAADDWAVIEVNNSLDVSIPVLKLSHSAAPVADSPAFVIQHPGGDRKRLAYVRNQITFFNERVVQYLSDTQTGSSGSPVLNDEGMLIALHHAGGRPQEVAGKSPLRKNEGIRISRVIEGLSRLGIVAP
jgi:V8-like Glu-specific endopeptidase